MVEPLSWDDGPRTEWAVEVTWRDWQRAGAKGPTSQYGPFENEDHLNRFLAEQRRDRDVAATRVLTRLAAYTAWTGPSQVLPTSEEERQVLLTQAYESMFGRATPFAPTQDEENDNA